MRALSIITVVLAHILLSSYCNATEPLVYVTRSYSSSGELLGKLLLPRYLEFTDRHKHTGHFPRERLTLYEYMFIVNLGVRFEILLDTFKWSVRQATSEETLQGLKNRLGPQFERIADNVNKSIRAVREEMKQYNRLYDEEEFTLELKDPRSFTNKDRLGTMFKLMEEIYKEVEKTLEKSVKDEELKKKHLWAIKRNTVLIAFSAEIMFLKMLYDIGYDKSLKMQFIQTGVMYLFVFEVGMCGKVLRQELEDEFEHFNKFLENFHGAAEELVDKTLFEIREDELPLELNETCHRDLELMYKDIREMIRPLITLNGMEMKKTKE